MKWIQLSTILCKNTVIIRLPLQCLSQPWVTLSTFAHRISRLPYLVWEEETAKCPWKYHLPIVWWDCSQSGNYHPLSTDCILNLYCWLYYCREQKHECFETESSEQDRKLGESANRNFSCRLCFCSFLLSSSSVICPSFESGAVPAYFINP